jgi:hypothetical protein
MFKVRCIMQAVVRTPHIEISVKGTGIPENFYFF